MAQIIILALGLIALYLIVTNGGGFTQAIGGLSNFSSTNIQALQGR